MQSDERAACKRLRVSSGQSALCFDCNWSDAKQNILKYVLNCDPFQMKKIVWRYDFQWICSLASAYHICIGEWVNVACTISYDVCFSHDLMCVDYI